jgi:TRAP transporter TAXI family solute receptor
MVHERIKSVQDLKGKSINIGKPGSGQRMMSIEALEALGIHHQRDVKAMNDEARNGPKLLRAGRIDAFIYTVGHPSGLIKEATSGPRKVRLVSMPPVRGLLEKPYFSQTTIPISFYPNCVNKEDVSSVGLKATFVTSELVPDDVVYGIVKEVFDHLETFKGLHPSYVTLTKRKMLDALSAPIHSGAMKYYKEIGLR